MENLESWAKLFEVAFFINVACLAIHQFSQRNKITRLTILTLKNEFNLKIGKNGNIYTYDDAAETIANSHPLQNTNVYIFFRHLAHPEIFLLPSPRILIKISQLESPSWLLTYSLVYGDQYMRKIWMHMAVMTGCFWTTITFYQNINDLGFEEWDIWAIKIAIMSGIYIYILTSIMSTFEETCDFIKKNHEFYTSVKTSYKISYIKAIILNIVKLKISNTPKKGIGFKALTIIITYFIRFVYWIASTFSCLALFTISLVAIIEFKNLEYIFLYMKYGMILLFLLSIALNLIASLMARNIIAQTDEVIPSLVMRGVNNAMKNKLDSSDKSINDAFWKNCLRAIYK